ncbi:MAG: type III-A CRISPR-associated RAMP protein Csm5 [Nitrospirae bacterium]|nr:type III-A CRISPR-associated RAMP protein Csm5 [Nitrospirota bacterium]
MKTCTLRCQILSPLHIGTGSELSPLDYIIKNSTLYVISFGRLVNMLNEKDRDSLEKIIDTGDLIKLRSFVSNIKNIQEYSLYAVEVKEDIKLAYNKNINNIQNQLLIQPFIKTEGGTKLLIPGSSLKGALRTAVINKIALELKVKRPQSPREEYEFEKTVLGYKDAKSDPFRGVKVRDKTLPDNSTIVREVKNVYRSNKTKALTSKSMQLYHEVTHSAITGKTVEFDTEIIFETDLFDKKYLSMSLEINGIRDSCMKFYKSKFDLEHENFYKGTEVEPVSDVLRNTTFDDASFVIRVGRFSGVESVTIDEYRSPRPPRGRIWGTTRNLADGLYPMGWVKCTILNRECLNKA